MTGGRGVRAAALPGATCTAQGGTALCVRPPCTLQECRWHGLADRAASREETRRTGEATSVGMLTCLRALGAMLCHRHAWGSASVERVAPALWVMALWQLGSALAVIPNPLVVHAAR